MMYDYDNYDGNATVVQGCLFFGGAGVIWVALYPYLVMAMGGGM